MMPELLAEVLSVWRDVDRRATMSRPDTRECVRARWAAQQLRTLYRGVGTGSVPADKARTKLNRIVAAAGVEDAA